MLSPASIIKEKETIMTDRKNHKVEPEKIKLNDLMTFTYYTKVISTSNNGEEIQVLDLDDNHRNISIRGRDLIANAHSADQFQEEEKVSKTRAAELLVGSTSRPFTVCFTKSDGEERVLRGRLVRPEPLLGRSMVEDLDAPGQDRLRQVDHRTIQFLIVDGVKYIVK